MQRIQHSSMVAGIDHKLAHSFRDANFVKLFANYCLNRFESSLLLVEVFLIIKDGTVLWYQCPSFFIACEVPSLRYRPNVDGVLGLHCTPRSSNCSRLAFTCNTLMM